MPSRRSDRGGALRRQLERAEKQRPDLEQALEDRRRFESERDHAFRVGFEEWDHLDRDTREALVREAVVVGGVSSVADLATAPRRLGINKAVRSILSRVSPDLFRKVFARPPRESVKDLMGRIRQVRTDRAAARTRREKEIAKIEQQLKDGTLPEAQRGSSTFFNSDEIKRMAFQLATRRKSEMDKDLDVLAQAIMFSKKPVVANARMAAREEGVRDELRGVTTETPKFRDMAKEAAQR